MECSTAIPTEGRPQRSFSNGGRRNSCLELVSELAGILTVTDLNDFNGPAQTTNLGQDFGIVGLSDCEIAKWWYTLPVHTTYLGCPENVDFSAVFRGSRRGTENPSLSASCPTETKTPAK